MPNLAANGVTVLETWTEGGLHGKRHVAKRVTLNLRAMGSTTNRITATVLGFKRIVDSSGIANSTSGDLYLAFPSSDGSILLLVDPSVAANTPADITDIVTLIVKGIA